MKEYSIDLIFDEINANCMKRPGTCSSLALVDAMVTTKEARLHQQDYFSQFQVRENSGVYTGQEGLEAEALNIEFPEDFDVHMFRSNNLNSGQLQK